MSTAKLIKERMELLGIVVKIYDHEKDSTEQFINSLSESLLIVMSISGYSKVFSDFMQGIIEVDKTEEVIVMTSKKISAVMNRFIFFPLGEKSDIDATSDVEQWTASNEKIIYLLEIFTEMAKCF